MHVETRFSRQAAIAGCLALSFLFGLLGCQKEPATTQQSASEQAMTAAKESEQAKAAEAAVVASVEQTTCPVMEGNPIDKAIFVEYKGKKVYFCCEGCPERFQADPAQYIAKLPQFKE